MSHSNVGLIGSTFFGGGGCSSRQAARCAASNDRNAFANRVGRPSLYTSYTVFCRGVGPVEWHYEDGFGNGYEAVLKAKGF